MSTTRLRIATLQLNPLIGAVEENISRADHILSLALSKHQSTPPDLLVLPELALSGYNFTSATHISPYLESLDQKGPMLKWGAAVSKTYGCFTVLGYPELKSGKIFNSAAVFDRTGALIHNYNKSFLYETDEVWGCNEGKGFQSFQLMEGVRASIGICMDLNPYKFEAPFNKFEFSQHCRDDGVNLVICPMAWLHAKSPSITEVSLEQKRADSQEFVDELHNVKGEYVIDVDYDSRGIDEYEVIDEYKSLHKPDFHNLNYWLLRFFPFMNHVMKPYSNFTKRATVVYCNRSGVEDTIAYGGTSSIAQFNGTSGVFGYNTVDLTNKSVKVLGALGKGDEGILIRDVDV